MSKAGKNIWIGARCHPDIKRISADAWHELCGYTLSDVYDRHAAGLGFTCLYDQQVAGAIQTLVGKVRTFRPAVSHKDGAFVQDLLGRVTSWRSSLLDEKERLVNGTDAVYYDDVLLEKLQGDGDGSDKHFLKRLTLQAAMKATEFKELSPDGLKWKVKQLIGAYLENPGDYEERGGEPAYWWEVGKLDYIDRYNLRAPEGQTESDSDDIRSAIEFVYDVPRMSGKTRLQEVEHDIRLLDTYSAWKGGFRARLKKSKEDKTYKDKREGLRKEDAAELLSVLSKACTCPGGSEGIECKELEKPGNEEPKEQPMFANSGFPPEIN